MTEKEKMEHQKLYDANYDKELESERIRCKSLCQKYNNLPVENIDERHIFIKSIIGRTGKNIHIEPDFWCDYGYRITVGENFYSNQWDEAQKYGEKIIGSVKLKKVVNPLEKDSVMKEAIQKAMDGNKIQKEYIEKGKKVVKEAK